MDDRARVPFALIGVVLLVSSAALTATLPSRPIVSETAVDRSVERVESSTRSTVRSAVSTAARNAAGTPVLTPANTTAGRVLNDSNAFRDALRLRIYVRVRQRLRAVGDRRGGVTTTASLPATPNETMLRRAKRRVHVEGVGANDTRLRVRIENVTVRSTRDNRTVASETVSPTVVVDSPVLALHDRVSTYERKLNRGHAKPGFAQQLTARLYPVAWARGYGQYGNLPIENVVTNRHVELMANGALLAEQRATFGGSDPQARSALTRASAEVALEDLGAGMPSGAAWLDTVYDEARRPQRSVAGPAATAANATGPNATMNVSVGHTADEAFRRTITTENLSAVLGSVYSANVTVTKRITGRDTTAVPAPDPPSDAEPWSNSADWNTTTFTVVGNATGEGAVPAGYHALATYTRRVNRTRTRTRRWQLGQNTTTTETTRSDTFLVTVTVAGRHAPTTHGPDRPITSVHERASGPLDGPNLAGVRANATERVVADRGGADTLAKRAASGSLDTSVRTVTGARPDGLQSWLGSNLTSLRERVRDVNVTASRGAVGTFRTNPPAELAAAIRRNRSDLLAAPDSYDGVADRARVAVRAAYLDRVLADLDERAAARRDRRRQLNSTLSNTSVGSLSSLRSGMNASDSTTAATVRRVDGLNITVQTSPHYLTLSEVGHDRVPAIPDGKQSHPLVAKNVNLFAIPYGDTTDSLVSGLFGSTERVPLSTAAKTLRASNRTLSRRQNATLVEERDALQRSVAAGNEAVRADLVVTLRSQNVGANYTHRRAIITEGLSTWNTTATRALALTNGSAVPAIVAVARTEAPNQTDGTLERERLSYRLQNATDHALASKGVQPAQSSVNGTATLVRDTATPLLKSVAANATRMAANRTAQRLFNETMGEIPAGLPLAPVPGYWYATTNVWYVDVRGEYERVVVRAQQAQSVGSTTDGVAYVRDGETATLDVDGDGTDERLGTASRVSFRATTSVVVVVPPGGTGVGDRGGNMDERSAGWPTPGRTDDGIGPL